MGQTGFDSNVVQEFTQVVHVSQHVKLDATNNRQRSIYGACLCTA